MKIIALICFAGILSFQTVTTTRTQGEERFLSSLERVLKGKEPEWVVNKIVLPAGAPLEHQLDNGKPLLSPRGAMHSYQLKSKQWAISISVFYGDTQRDAVNKFDWELRSWEKKGESLREAIGDQAAQIVGKESAMVMSRKAKVWVILYVAPVNTQKEEKSSQFEAQTERALEIAYRFTKDVIDQASAN